MKLVKVQSLPRFQTLCRATGSALDTETTDVFADLDGPAFDAYFCDWRCASNGVKTP